MTQNPRREGWKAINILDNYVDRLHRISSYNLTSYILKSNISIFIFIGNFVKLAYLIKCTIYRRGQF
jgi:hypothetical protein